MRKQSIKAVFIIPVLINAPYWQPVFKHLASYIQDFRVFTSMWKDYLPEYKDSFKVNIIPGFKYKHSASSAKSKGFYSPGFGLANLNILLKLIKSKPGIIITSAYNIWTLQAVLYKLLFRKKMILFYEGSSLSFDYRESRLRTLYRKVLSKFVDHFLTNTNSAKAYLVKFLNIKEERISRFPIQTPDNVLFTGDQNLIKNSNDNRGGNIKFFMASQIIERKGIDNLIEAACQLKRLGYDDFVIEIAGKGEKFEEYSRKTLKLRLENQIKFLGFQNYNEMIKNLKASDVYLFPTLEDTWGVAPLEALAAGKPVLISKYAGSSELVENYSNGIVFDPVNIEDFTEKLIWVIEHPMELKKMSENAYETIRIYNASSSARYINETIQRVCPTKI
ncbi:MAG: glycosyltransferase family 4 protein [Calditrichaceae bacterium]|nr:glycosyltransferase family 4 protein [Calditrichia bacterium]NUQ42882.1 glycosyltransferase family 4 protein [Calditrichaceae bacterium]